MLSGLFFPRSRYQARCIEETDKLDLKGKNVLVVGGTDGIGAAICRRFAMLGATVSFAGRAEYAAKTVAWEMNLAQAGHKGKFYKVELSSMAEVERFTDEVIKDVQKKGGIDYLILTAGGPPTGHWRGPTHEGLERAFAVQCMARFYTTYRLLPVIKESVVVIASPGFGKFYDEKDPGFEKPENRKQLTMIRQGRRDALFLDAIFKEFSIRNPKITFHHLFPGIVDTYALHNQGFPPLVLSLADLVYGSIASDPDNYASVAVSKAVATSSTGGLFLSQHYGWKVGLERWARDETKRKELFEWALQRAQTAARQKPPEPAGDKIKETK